MSADRLTRTSQSWYLAYASAFANPAAPTVAELNDTAFVHDFSCALTETGTSLVKAGSDTDDEISFCSTGNESTPTFKNFTAQWTGWHDANTGGSGSTVDLTSLFNKLWAFIAFPDIPYYIISRTGEQGQQGLPWVAGNRVKSVGFKTDLPVEVIEQGSTLKIQQNFLFEPNMGFAFNYEVA